MNWNINPNLDESFSPVFFRRQNTEQERSYQQLLSENKSLRICDEIDGQLRELIKSLHPSRKIKAEEYPELIKTHLNGTDINSYGVWVYYPWLNTVVHILDEDEFVEVRTNRNRYKITREEQEQLRNRKIGVIGLSVGQSIALTLAMERTCGELRLADFDTAELSNLNRIRTGIHNLGLRKTVIAAREISELDPYLKVRIFNDGLTKTNIDEFFTGDGKLDIVVEVCDGLDVKILSRYKARELQIPVVMDTNDRGMLDVERFDLEPDRMILHGLAGDLDPDKLQSLSNEDKIPYILQMVGSEDLSTRLKASMIEVEQTINTWPQLASSVTLGGAITTDVCRRILLDQYRESGRYYVDIDRIISDNTIEEKNEVVQDSGNNYPPLSLAEIKQRAQRYKGDFPGKKMLEQQQLDALTHAAAIAPSAGNNQPWKWYVHDGVFYLYHDKSRSYSWGDFNEIGAYEGLGTAIENVNLKAEELNLSAEIQLFPVAEDKQFIATIYFKDNPSPNPVLQELSANMAKRHTNRRNGERVPLEPDFYKGMEKVMTSIPGVEIQFVNDDEKLGVLAEVISATDRLRLLDERGHKEFFHEVRWTSADAAESADGIDIALADVSAGEVAGFKMATDWKAVSLLSEWDKGRAFQKMSRKSVAAASGMGLVLMQSFDYFDFINVGRAVQRGWIYANMHDVSIHPMLSPVFFFNMLKHGDKGIMSDSMREELVHIRGKYERVFDLGEGKAELFLLKLAKAPEAKGQSHRLPFDQVFYID